jgi:hypothetical protein
MDALEALGPVVFTDVDYDWQQEGLLVLSVRAREAAVCISTRPTSLRQSA